ncbi:MAG: 4Fe-4S ferredoxin [Candidatus Marinimicrobia bacterium]|nr:4Fe-4S ferredoxin [Candidatus Neomarinimicrobiota bacterium]|tara:strand:+ start:8271 stop:9881 length:1611 start_codon:yes stop_codon:yes gene_type:complete
MNYGFVIDNRLCIGCHACTVACKSEHDVPIGVNRTHVKYIEKGIFPNSSREFSVHRCNHCSDAPCVEICPTTALYTRTDGIVDFDNDRCIGCKSCMQACPYDALYIDPETNTAAKCNYCAHRIDGGYEPACVIVCPVEAIISGDVNDSNSKISNLLSNEETMVRKPEKQTVPNLYYINGSDEMLNPNLSDANKDYVWSGQSTGVGHYAKFSDNRLSQSDSENLLIQLAMENSVRSGNQIDQRAVDNVAKEIQNDIDSKGVRRVYDSPSKGVLWGWEVTGYVWTKAIATGTFLMAAMSKFLSFGIDKISEINSLFITLFFMLLTGALLVKDLDRPDRFLYVLLRPQWKSWLVKGAYIISIFGGIVTLLIADYYYLNMRIQFLWVFGVLFSVLGAVYTAFLFNQARARDLWQSPWTSSLHMLIHAIMAGAVAMIYLSPVTMPKMIYVLKYAIIVNLVLIAKELILNDDKGDMKKSINMIMNGYYSRYFWTGILLGNILPFCLFYLYPEYALYAGTLVLLGSYLTEFVRIRVPQMIPLS